MIVSVFAAEMPGKSPVGSVESLELCVVLTMARWEGLAEKLTQAGVTFGIAPTIRFKGQPGEQATMFFRDPSGNALEFKAFGDMAQVFAK